MKKSIIIIALVSVLLIAGYIGYEVYKKSNDVGEKITWNGNPDSKDKPKLVLKGPDSYISISEEKATLDELEERAELKVSGHFTRLVAENIELPQSEDTSIFILPNVVYEFEVNEVYKGSYDQEKMSIIFTYHTSDLLYTNTEYLLYLQTGARDDDEYYFLISNSQGYFRQEWDNEKDKVIWKNWNGYIVDPIKHDINGKNEIESEGVTENVLLEDKPRNAIMKYYDDFHISGIAYEVTFDVMDADFEFN